MLDHLKQRVVETLAQSVSATLSTWGPAGIQASIFPCEATAEVLHVLVPRTSDHLLNIEDNPSVVITTEGWQLHGKAEILPALSADLAISRRVDAQWCKVVRITPSRLHIVSVDRLDRAETIDII